MRKTKTRDRDARAILNVGNSFVGSRNNFIHEVSSVMFRWEGGANLFNANIQ